MQYCALLHHSHLLLQVFCGKVLQILIYTCFKVQDLGIQEIMAVVEIGG